MRVCVCVENAGDVSVAVDVMYVVGIQLKE